MIRKKILLVLVSLVVLAIALPCFADTVTYEYDDLYRLIKATYADGSVIEYSYDAAGNRLAKVVQSVAGVTAWKSPGSCVNVDRSGGKEWADPSYAQASDNNKADCHTAKNAPTDWLQCTTFGFTTGDIPASATVGGIEVHIERSVETAGKTRDDAIYLRGSGGQVGDNKAVTGTYWPTSDAYAAYGGASDTWNAGLSDSAIRDSGFGVDISALRDSFTYQTEAFVDHVRIRVHYTTGPAPAPTVTISANPVTIYEGQSSTLTWSSTDATSCSIDQGIGSVDLNGTMPVSPTATTTYTITATGDGGTETDTVTVTVVPPPPPPNVTISADPASIDYGGTSTLTWSSTDADSCEIDQGVGTVAPPEGGSIDVSPTVTTTYTITATGISGADTDSVTVTVAPPPEPTVSISANPASIEYGETSTLSWTSTDADISVTIDQGIGAVAESGSTPVSPAVTTTYTITAEGTGGTAQDSVTVTVTSSPPPTVSISADPASIYPGNSSTLTWSSNYATSCEIDQGVGAVSPPEGGSVDVSPTVTTTYTITATGPGGTATDSVSVTVVVSGVTDWKSPGTCVNVDRSGGKEWADPSYAQASDNNKADCHTAKSAPTDWLQCTTFGFTTGDIPAGATVGGIEVHIERSVETAGKTRDDAIYLRGSGGQVGDNKAVTGTYWPTSDAYAAYGGASDTWNAGLSDGAIRDSGFGVDISALRDSFTYQTEAFVDHVRIRVHYTLPTP